MPPGHHAQPASLDLGIIGNGTINALIDARGRIVWHCVPAFDGDPVFCSLLSPKAGDTGFFDIALENETKRQQRYIDNSAVLVTVLTAKDGAQVEITDFAPRYKLHERTYHPMQILRRVRPLSGSPRIALRLRPLTKLDDRAKYWRKRAERIRKLALEHAVHKDGHFVESFDGEDLDASLLLLEGLRFVRADDPRFIKTVDAVGKKLMRNGYLLRYAQPDDFGAPSSSFLVCNFWYVEALIAIGRRDEARKLFEKLLAIRNPLGLLSEDFDPKRKELWGNFPQTYSMVGLINAARCLSTQWSDVV